MECQNSDVVGDSDLVQNQPILSDESHDQKSDNGMDVTDINKSHSICSPSKSVTESIKADISSSDSADQVILQTSVNHTEKENTADVANIKEEIKETGEEYKNTTGMVTFKQLIAESKCEDSSVTVKEENTSDEREEKPAFNDMQTSSSSETSSDSEPEHVDSDTNTEKQAPAPEDKSGPLVPGELTINDLPLIEDLKITLDEKVTLNTIGSIESIVDCLVIIRANKGTPPLNEDSVLFKEDRVCLGKVFETFGPVVSPFYSIRFNSPEEITKSGIQAGQVVYFAPQEDKTLTTYVFVNHLKQLKGSDASWNGNLEPPARFLDYSDDEEERLAKRRLREERSEQNEGPPDPDNPESQNDNRKRKNRTKQERNSNSQNPAGLRQAQLVRPAFGEHRPRFNQPRHQHPHRQLPPSAPPPWLESHQPSMESRFSGPVPRQPSPYHRFGAPPQHFGGGPGPRSGGPGNRPPPPHQGPTAPNYGPQAYQHHSPYWQNYGGHWTEQDNNYYSSESPPVPKTNFVDPRFVQQSMDKK